ncbi:MAG: PilZ domain-containing protein [Polyangiaceae bacterium]
MSERIDPRGLGVERRRTTRVVVDLEARDSRRASGLRVRDLSLGGARCDTRTHYVVGAPVTLELSAPRLALSGTIASASRGAVRIQFGAVPKRDLVKLAEALWSDGLP